MRKIIVLIFLVIIYCHSNARNEPAFSFEIPDSLKKNADVVYLFYHTTYTRTSKKDLKEEVHYAVTLLSDRADDYADFVLQYDQFSKIGNIECTLYDAKGEKIRKLKKNEIGDVVSFDGSTLLGDNRNKYFSANNPGYPYTIELKYDVSNNGFLALPTWYPVRWYREAYIENTLTVKFPEEFPIRFKEVEAELIQQTEFDEGQYRCCKWEISNQAAIEYERYSPRFKKQVARILLSPEEFEFDGSEGDLKSWNSLGLWSYGLQPKEYTFTAATEQKLAQLKKDYPNTLDLCEQVYKYMQSRTRYVGIQLGIGGFKPMNPELVDKVCYGDCKALSYYTKALLERVGIQSIYTEIGVNNVEIEFDDYASENQSNHIILCVPMANDTVWLECTSQTAPFNHLFDGTCDRKALLITSEGGKLTKTVKEKESKRIGLVEVEILGNGDVKCITETKYQGSFYDDNFSMVKMSDKELRERTLKNSSIGDMNIIAVKISHQERIPEINLTSEFTSKNYISKAGNRLFLELSSFLTFSKVSPQKETRRNPVYWANECEYTDTVVLNIPRDYQVEYTPDGSEIESEFGNYKSIIDKNDSSIIFSRTYSIHKGEYPKEKYMEWLDFLNASADANQCKVILKQL